MFDLDLHGDGRGELDSRLQKLVAAGESVQLNSDRYATAEHPRFELPLAGPTDVYMQEIPESVEATVNAINAELRVSRKKLMLAEMFLQFATNCYQPMCMTGQTIRSQDVRFPTITLREPTIDTCQSSRSVVQKCVR